MIIEASIDIESYINMTQDFKFKQRLRVTYKDLKNFMNFYGFYEHRQKSSTHIIYKNKITGQTIPVPYSNGTICQGTVSKILKQMNLNRNDLAKYLYN